MFRRGLLFHQQMIDDFARFIVKINRDRPAAMVCARRTVQPYHLFSVGML